MTRAGRRAGRLTLTGWESASFMQYDRLLQHRATLDAIRDRNPEQAHAQVAAPLRDSLDNVKQALRSRGGASTV